MEIQDVWEIAVDNATYQQKGKRSKQRPRHDVMAKSIRALQECDLFELYEDLTLDNLRADLQTRIIPTFRKQVLSGGASDLLSAVMTLHQSMKWYFQLVPSWPDPHDFATKIMDLFVACLHWELDEKMREAFAEFYAHAFQVNMWQADQQAKEESLMEEEEDGDLNEDHITLEWGGRSVKMPKTECDDFLQNKFIPLTSHYLFDLDLLSTFAEQPVSRVLEVEVKRYVEKTCKGEYEKCWLNTHLKNWVETDVMRWLENVFGKTWSGSEPSAEFNYGLRAKRDKELTKETAGRSRRQWSQKLLFILYETYTEMRIGEMFRIITDFDESAPAIEDLKIGLERTNLRPYLIETLRKDLSSRVLHPGVCTSDIITMYIGAVKALRLLDPSGVVMEIVLEPYTKYLTERDDAVRMIMTELLDDDRENSDLAQELAMGTNENAAGGPVHPANPSDNFFVEQVTKRPEDWVPDPREADPEKPDKSRRTSDIISLLVGMYGSTKKFIEEYQELLSKRLYANWCSGTSEDAEIKNLELLKLRFGEEDMGCCAVMLKDVADSKRVNSYVKDEYSKQNDIKSEIDVSTLIVSSEYWPDVQTHDLNLPKVAQNSFDQFVKGYEAHKASRSLRWIRSAGRVDIELELKDRTLQMQVTPLLASVIVLFQDKDTWTLSDISEQVKIPLNILRRKISYWLQQGVLRETNTDTYTVIEEQTSGATVSRLPAPRDDLDDLLQEDSEEKASAENLRQKQQEQVLWTYVKGMLTNFASLPIDRIHKMLRMFALQDSNMQMDQVKLRTFLMRKVQEGTLRVEAGKYCLNKKT